MHRPCTDTVQQAQSSSAHQVELIKAQTPTGGKDQIGPGSSAAIGQGCPNMVHSLPALIAEVEQRKTTRSKKGDWVSRRSASASQESCQALGFFPTFSKTPAPTGTGAGRDLPKRSFPAQGPWAVNDEHGSSFIPQSSRQSHFGMYDASSPATKNLSCR